MAQLRALLPLMAIACHNQPPQTAPAVGAERPWRLALTSQLANGVGMFDDEPLGSALGLSSEAVDDSTIEVLLGHRLTFPARVTVGILHLPGAMARRSWFFTGEAGDLTQTLADSVVAAISRAPRVERAAVLPVLVVGDQPTVARLREAAARLQAQVLMVYRPNCRLYERVPFVGSTQYRAVCTIEALALDTRSGVIPFSTIITREDITRRERGDFDATGTWRRIQLQALVKAVVEVSIRMGTFLSSVPEPG